MGKEILRFTIPLNPATKKNSMQILYNQKTKRPFVSQSKKYKEYERDCGIFIKGKGLLIDYPVTVTTLFYRVTKHTVDITNLMSATHDILVKYGVLKDDSYKIVKSVDGSRVDFDKDNPRTEIIISEWSDGK